MLVGSQAQEGSRVREVRGEGSPVPGLPDGVSVRPVRPVRRRRCRIRRGAGWRPSTTSLPGDLACGIVPAPVASLSLRRTIAANPGCSGRDPGNRAQAVRRVTHSKPWATAVSRLLGLKVGEGLSDAPHVTVERARGTALRGAVAVTAGAVAPVAVVAAHVGGPLWPVLGTGALLTAIGYALHRRILADAVEQGRWELVRELDEVADQALAGEPGATHRTAEIATSSGDRASAGCDGHREGDVVAAGAAGIRAGSSAGSSAGASARASAGAGASGADAEPGRLATAVLPGALDALPRPRPAADPSASRTAASRTAASGSAASGSAASLTAAARATSQGRSDSRTRLEAIVARLVAGATAASDAFDPVWDVDVTLGRDGRIRDLSATPASALGWRASDLVGQPFAGLVHVADLPVLARLVEGVLAAGPVPAPRVREQVRVRTRDGAWRVLEWSAQERDGDTGPVVALSGHDVTTRLQVEADLLHQVSHDSLTGLPNRVALLRLAVEAVAAAGPANPLSVLVIDLDRFKDVNDSLGHAVGDDLLALVGPRLRAALRPTDTIARLGGDEFAVLLPTAGEDGARAIADRLAEALDSPFEVDGMDLHVEASIGIAVSHRDQRVETTMVEGLLREADIAMYRAKDEGSGIVQFDPERDTGHGRSRLALSAELRRAISEGQLRLHYQPTVDVLEGRLAGVEALVRWQHPERGLLPPGVFLPLAESTGLIMPLSRWVLAIAVDQAARWNRAGMPTQIAVNLSPRWLQHSDIPAIVADLLGEHDVPPELLRLEITESVVLAHPEHALGQLKQLRAMGIGLSLDDFGTGYSSMTHLRNLPVDEVKVDRGFVQAMTTSPEDAVIVRAAIELGHNLGMDVVAEGIEDADTLAEIVASGCSLAQGYYFSQALPADDLVAWARERFPDFGTPEGPPATRVPHPMP